MRSDYLYGEQIEYDIDLVKPEDYKLLQAFSCGNEQLDCFIHNELIQNNEVDSEDGLAYKVFDKKDGSLLAIFSLAASGIVVRMDTYMHVFPAIKIDVLAVDTQYQKFHINKMSESSANPEDHFYFSDSVLCEIIKRCREIAENWATARFIVLYADKKARRYYERNMFNDFSEFMEKENNSEIRENDPMYLILD